MRPRVPAFALIIRPIDNLNMRAKDILLNALATLDKLASPAIDSAHSIYNARPKSPSGHPFLK